MFIDITTKVTPQLQRDAQGNEKKALSGHLGTHLDTMDKEFPLEYIQRTGVVFDVSQVRDRDIDVADIALGQVLPGMFAIFCTGFIEEEGYGTQRYFKEHPQLSDALIDALLDRQVSLIGIDCAGIRRGVEHTPKDQYCADRGVFVVENLCSLPALLKGRPSAQMTVNTYPVNYAGMSGLPCRVVAQEG